MRRMRDMTASVGVSGKNLSADVWLIQELLNKPEVLNGDRPFMVNGKMDAITVERIKAFQKKYCENG